MEYAQTRIFLENETYQIFWDFEIQTNEAIQARKPDLVLINKKKRICQVDFAVPEKKQKSEKTEKYLDLARELK